MRIAILVTLVATLARAAPACRPSQSDSSAVRAPTTAPSGASTEVPTSAPTNAPPSAANSGTTNAPSNVPSGLSNPPSRVEATIDDLSALADQAMDDGPLVEGDVAEYDDFDASEANTGEVACAALFAGEAEGEVAAEPGTLTDTDHVPTFDDFADLDWWLAEEAKGVSTGSGSGAVEERSGDESKSRDVDEDNDGIGIAHLDERADPPGMTAAAIRNVTEARLKTWITPARFAAAAYVSSDKIRSWTCGEHCSAINAPRVIATGGDGKDDPYWFVATHGKAVVVSIQGTNSKSWASINNNLDTLRQVVPNVAYYPSSEACRIHRSFYGTFMRMGAKIGQAVETQVNNGTKSILVVGHSQGAALGQLASVYLQKLTGPKGGIVTARLFATPRVGNPAWADYVDATLGQRSQMMFNANDPVPHIPLPGMADGYRRSSNELWIPKAGEARVVACPGQENQHCSNQIYWGNTWKVATAIAQWITGRLDAHSGPFVGVLI